MTHEAGLTSLFPSDVADIIREYRDVYPLVYKEESFPLGSLSEYCDPKVSLGNFVHQALKTKNLFLVLKMLIWSVDENEAFTNTSTGCHLFSILKKMVMSKRHGPVLSFGFGHGYIHNIPNHTSCGCDSFPFSEIENLFILPDGQKLVSSQSSDVNGYSPRDILYPEYDKYHHESVVGHYVPYNGTCNFIQFTKCDMDDEDHPSEVEWDEPDEMDPISITFTLTKSFSIGFYSDDGETEY